MKNQLKNSGYMKMAINLARKAEGRTSPNPVVGCVIVKNNQIIGRGYHARAGSPHAEAMALTEAGANAAGADVYVTLEPCSHFGRTPPCADALIQAGVSRVVVATKDPNPLVSGQGIERITRAGIDVEVGLLEEEASVLNEAFIKCIRCQLPFVLYKSAITLDGKIAVHSGDSKWVASPIAREYVHHLRNTFDVIMVGSNTIAEDNPLLTCRGVADGRNPVRLIVDGMLISPLDSQIFNCATAKTIVATTHGADPDKLAHLKKFDNLEIWQYDSPLHVPLMELMKDVAAKGYNSVLLEGGGVLAGKMLSYKLIDKVEFIISPKLAGSGPSPLSGLKLDKMADAIPLHKVQISTLGEDYKITGYINK